MKIGVTQIILGDMSFGDMLDLCREARYEAVELVFGEEGDLNVHLSDDQIRQVGARCREAGVEIGSLLAHPKERGNLLSRDPQERHKCRRRLERSLEIASLLGVGAVLLHPGQLEVAGTYEKAWNEARDILREVAALAAEKRVAIGVENVWNKFLLSPREARLFVDEIGSEWVGIYLDTANMMAYGFPEHWIRELGGRIVRVHFKDFKRREHRFVNLLDGDTDWQTIMRELRAIGYDSTLIHEVGGDRKAQIDLAERMRRIVALQ